MIIKMEITDRIKELAKKNKYEKVTFGKEYVLPTSKFWAGEKQFQNFIGNIGELVFEQFLLNHGIPYEKDVLYLNRGDYFDFKIHGKTLDTKTGRFKSGSEIPQTPNYCFFIGEHQLKKEVDYYAHVQLDAEIQNAFIVGFLPREDTKKYEVVYTEAMKGAAVAIPLSNLIAMEFFKQHFKPRGISAKLEEKKPLRLEDWL